MIVYTMIFLLRSETFLFINRSWRVDGKQSSSLELYATDTAIVLVGATGGKSQEFFDISIKHRLSVFLNT